MLKNLLFTMLKNFTTLKMFFKKSLLYKMLKNFCYNKKCFKKV